jgi:hypothetical protein
VVDVVVMAVMVVVMARTGQGTGRDSGSTEDEQCQGGEGFLESHECGFLSKVARG